MSPEVQNRGISGPPPSPKKDLCPPKFFLKNHILKIIYRTYKMLGYVETKVVHPEMVVGCQLMYFN